MFNPAGTSVWTKSHICMIFLIKITRGRVDAGCHGAPLLSVDLRISEGELFTPSRSSLITARPRGRKVICQTELSASAHSGSSSADLLDINIHVWTPKTRTLCFKGDQNGALIDRGPATALLQIACSTFTVASGMVRGFKEFEDNM